MKALVGMALLALVLMAASSRAEDVVPATDHCDVPAFLLATGSKLPKVTDAVRTARKLNILVIGSRSSTITSADGSGYPGRMEAALRARLPSVEVKVELKLQIKRTAEAVVKNLPKLIEGKKPDLIVWQTGTVDAIRSIELDEFRAALDSGVDGLRATGADVVLVTLQYNPRMESMISAVSYVDVMRVAAQQRDAPLFDRYAIMHQWGETGDFDFFSAVHGLSLARRVHDCLGRALSNFVIEAAHLNPAELRISR